tara:strand:+ start:2157 stop:2276 length:120 start_codon:yes stop_codon:yes gene_type:complete
VKQCTKVIKNVLKKKEVKVKWVSAKGAGIEDNNAGTKNG